MIDIQKTGTILLVGVAIGAAGSNLIRDGVGAVWRATPFSAQSKLEAAREDLRRTGEELAICTVDLRQHKAALDERDRLAATANGEAAEAISVAAERWGLQCRQAFDSGVAAGRAAGRAEARIKGEGDGTNATAGAGRADDGQPGAGGLPGRSFRDAWAGPAGP